MVYEISLSIFGIVPGPVFVLRFDDKIQIPFSHGPEFLL